MMEHSSLSPAAQPGHALRRARESLGLTQDEIAARTRIPIASVCAIEDEDWVKLPAPVYARGFLRLYANELGLDADEVVGAWRAAVGDAGGRQRPISARRGESVSHHPIRWVGAFAGLAAMAVVVGIVFALLADDVAPSDGIDAGQEHIEQRVPKSKD